MLFTTPAEARGLGGFIGNYAEIRTDQGRIEVSAFGRRQRLDRLLTEAGGGVCTGCSQELLDGYGRRGLTLGPNGGVADQVWSTLSEPSHFPYVGEAAASLYPLSGGTELDGVIVADPYVLQALMTFTGPIPVRELDTRVLRAKPRGSSSRISTSSPMIVPSASMRSTRWPPRSSPGCCRTHHRRLRGWRVSWPR